MDSVDRIIPSHAFGVSTLVTAIVASWFALTFAFTVGALFTGA